MRPLRPAEKQWLFESSALDNTPSRADGIALAKELEGRKQTISWIRSLWLRVASVLEEKDAESTAAKGVVTAGAILVHRFFMRRSLNDFEPKLVAPTILFLASKVEEAPLRLRHIVNACLDKFEPGALLWDPQKIPDQSQPLEYIRWEKDILATEEVALEALCFDMAVDQPWPVLRRAARKLNTSWDSAPTEGPDATAESYESKSMSKSRATEAVVNELGWAMLNEGMLSPLAVLYPAPVLAFATFVLIFAMVDSLPLSTALAAAAEIGAKFEVDVEFDRSVGARGEDLVMVQDALQKYQEYCKANIIDAGLLQYLDVTSGPPEAYQRRFKPPSTNGLAIHPSVQVNGSK